MVLLATVALAAAVVGQYWGFNWNLVLNSKLDIDGVRALVTARVSALASKWLS